MRLGKKRIDYLGSLRGVSRAERLCLNSEKLNDGGGVFIIYQETHAVTCIYNSYVSRTRNAHACTDDLQRPVKRFLIFGASDAAKVYEH